MNAASQFFIFCIYSDERQDLLRKSRADEKHRYFCIKLKFSANTINKSHIRVMFQDYTPPEQPYIVVTHALNLRRSDLTAEFPLED